MIQSQGKDLRRHGNQFLKRSLAKAAKLRKGRKGISEFSYISLFFAEKSRKNRGLSNNGLARSANLCVLREKKFES